MEKQQAIMAEAADDTVRDKAVRKFGNLEDRFSALGGYVAESEGRPHLQQPSVCRTGC